MRPNEIVVRFKSRVLRFFSADEGLGKNLESFPDSPFNTPRTQWLRMYMPYNFKASTRKVLCITGTVDVSTYILCEYTN